MASRNKVASAVAAVGVAAAMALGGTFAWQPISQTALIEASDVVNPGGRLHDDFDGTNKDVYVENFAVEPIIARIRLAEYFEVIANHGVEGAEKSIPILGSKSVADGKTTYAYKTFKGYSSLKDGVVSAGLETTGTGEAATTRSYWSWKTGGQTMYMPTFNKNKDSMAADLNGVYEEGNVGTISDRFDPDKPQYTGYVEYAEGETKTGTEVYDADANDAEDDGVTRIENVEHVAKPTGEAALMSMADWIDKGAKLGPYWVYDEDGWVYWAQAIPGRNEDGTTNATGLLLDSIELNQVMDDTWYYAIDVTAQFATPDDVGYEDGTGFYGVTNEAPSPDACKLLRALGANVPVSYSVSTSDNIEGLTHTDPLEDSGSGVTLTFVRKAGVIPLEDLASSFCLSATMSENGAVQPISKQAVKDMKPGPIPTEGGSPVAYAYDMMMVVVFEPCTLIDALEFEEPGIYLAQIGFGEGVEVKVELSTYSPTETMLEFAAESGMTAVLQWDGTFLISGSGEMANFSQIDQVSWGIAQEKATALVLDEGVTSIPGSAFSDFTSLESVDLPASLQSIGGSAFADCTSLESVDLPEGIATIADGTFSDCRGLSDVDLPESLESIGGSAFYGCTSLQSIDLPEGLESIGDSAFENCTSLQSVDLPEGLESIGDSAFEKCASLKAVAFEGDSGTIGKEAFSKCVSLQSVDLPEGLESIGENAFAECTSLQSLSLPDGLDSIAAKAFFGCTELEAVTFEGSIGTIGKNAFTGCTKLKTVTFKGKVEEIGESAFGGDVVVSLRANGCTELETVTFEGSVGTVGKNAFTDCTKLETVTFEGDVGTIGERAFSGDFSVGNTIAPGCTGLTSVTFKGAVGEIGGFAFENCDSLREVAFGQGVGSIKKDAFHGCESLESVGLSGIVGSIGEYAFAGCSKLTSIEIEGSEESACTIGINAFNGCSSLASVVLKGGIDLSAGNAFLACSSLTSVVLPNTLKSIGGNTFNFCSSLKEIYLPASLTEVDSQAFNNCPDITIYYAGTEDQWAALESGYEAICNASMPQ